MLALTVPAADAQSPLAIFTDSFVNGFDDWSWAAHSNVNTNPVHSGTYSMSVSAAAWQGVSFHHANFNTSDYTNFTFWAHGGTAGGQRLQVYGELSGVPQPAYALPSALVAGIWQKFSVSLASLGVTNKPNLSRLNIQLRDNGTTGTFYLDDVELSPNPLPALVQVSLNTTQTVRTVDARHFGVNLAIWDGYYDSPSNFTTAALLQEMGLRCVRVPGGSGSDEYHWASNTKLSETWQWQASFPEMMRVATNINAQVFVTVNHGSGSPQEAAAWVAYCNADAGLFGTANDVPLGVDSGGRNWQTAGYWSRLRSRTAAQNPDNQFDFLALGRSAPLGVKYWEVGNECYGTWEQDTNALAHHASTYAQRATNFIARMKAVDPTIKIGVVGVPGENQYDNGYRDHPAYNARTAQTNYGWTPVLVASLKSLGVTPDFLVHHHYPQWTDPNNVAGSPDNDAGLLQSTSNWANDAATLRQHVTDYFGSGGTNIELVVTENNTDAGQQGRQSTSLVNGLYYADSLGQLLQTEFNSFVWWDLRNGTDNAGFFGANLFGWRSYGDLGMINGLDTRHPAFYAAKLMQWFARPGDRILDVTSDYAALASYATRHANGAVSVLLLNKILATNFTVRVNVTGFAPSATAIIRSFGIPNDEATRTNGPTANRDITTNYFASAGATFTNNAPPYSLTLITLSPAPPRLAAFPLAGPGQLVFQLQGQTDVGYVIQTSSNLITWTSISTNPLTSSTLMLTNPVSPGELQKYWRAVWQP